MVHHVTCPLCLSENISAKLNCTDSFLSREVFQVAQCTECGFLFTQDGPDEKVISTYYESEDYISHSNISKGIFNKLYRLVRNFMLLRKRAIIKKTTGLKHGTLLDIGSGTGHFADTMKKGGWNVKGVEINEKARIFSIEQFGLDVVGPDDISELASAGYDCITLWHVLEHFHDPFKYASVIHRLLKPGGVCVIALPNSSSFDAGHYGKFWAAYDVPRHLWHFNPATFRQFADKTGFKIVKLLTLPLDLFYISILSEKYSGSRFPFFNGLITAKMYAFAALFRKEQSSSIIYILQRK